ncbi:hypothetical protein [Fervidibacillus halotolerans]|uniref:Uncharacterized protein n=1 Tax=Fervidibacillus halotolerans TaxID=2980027 RepID=A0A9E8LYQ7_9BACI|nr:hypothetical protein [Fervidibacillus halotolerans]WAA12021.1 hypothetical protein OE105_10600 [Fervidibacillus halotolerans]
MYYIKCIIRSIAYKNQQFVISIEPTKEYRFSDESITNRDESNTNRDKEILLAYKNGKVCTIDKHQLVNITVEEEFENVIKEIFVQQKIITIGLTTENGQGFRLVEMRVG